MAIPTTVSPQNHFHTNQCHNYNDMRRLQGGAVAVIRPPLGSTTGIASGLRATPRQVAEQQAFKIFFQPVALPQCSHVLVLQPPVPSASPNTLDAALQAAQGDLLIHSDGDLRSTLHSRPRHVLRLASHPSFITGTLGEDDHAVVVPLAELPFTLDVRADTGVIGRRVSIAQGEFIVGEGVLGWN